MICPHCGAQWQLPSTNNPPAKECPFCRGDMRIPDIKLTTIKSVFQEIVARFGVQVLENGQELLSLFSDLAPMLIAEKHLLQFMIECGVYAKLIELRNIDISAQEAACQQLSQQINDCIAEVYISFFAANGSQFHSSAQQTPMAYEYADLGDNNAELIRCKTPLQEEIRFPETIDGKKVTSISGSIFGTSRLKDSDRDKVRSIYIPNSVTNIGEGAFYGCKSLSSITLPSGLRSIGEYAFRSCKALNNIVIPQALVSIGKGAFAGCNITSIVLPEGIDSIQAETFKNCKCLAKIALPNSLKSIGEEAFSGCRSITSVILPENVTTIGSKAFQGCKSLTKAVLPNGVQTLGFSSFADCESLHSINLPDSISLIQPGSFSRCFALSNVVLPAKITTIETEVFERCWALANLSIPEGVTSIGYSAFYACKGLHITIPNSVKSIASDAFAYCEGITIHCQEDSFVHDYAKKKKLKILVE